MFHLQGINFIFAGRVGTGRGIGICKEKNVDLYFRQ